MNQQLSGVEISKFSNSIFNDSTMINKSYIPSSILKVSDDKNERLYILEKLIGNSRVAKELRNDYLKMII